MALVSPLLQDVMEILAVLMAVMKWLAHVSLDRVHSATHIINPWHAQRVMVVVLCVCVCLSVLWS